MISSQTLFGLWAPSENLHRGLLRLKEWRCFYSEDVCLKAEVTCREPWQRSSRTGNCVHGVNAQICIFICTFLQMWTLTTSAALQSENSPLSAFSNMFVLCADFLWRLIWFKSSRWRSMSRQCSTYRVHEIILLKCLLSVGKHTANPAVSL